MNTTKARRRGLLTLGLLGLAAPLGLAVRRALNLPQLPAFLRPRRPLPTGECTWYAWGRAAEAGWQIRFDVDYGRHARNWWEKVVNARRTDQPVVGAILVLDAWPGNPYGHVAYVEKVLGDGRFEITHANFPVGEKVALREAIPIYRATCTLTRDGISLDGGPSLPVRGFLLVVG